MVIGLKVSVLGFLLCKIVGSIKKVAVLFASLILCFQVWLIWKIKSFDSSRVGSKPLHLLCYLSTLLSFVIRHKNKIR